MSEFVKCATLNCTNYLYGGGLCCVCISEQARRHTKAVSDDKMVRIEVEMTATEWRDCLAEARRDNTTLSRWARAILVCESVTWNRRGVNALPVDAPSTEMAATSTNTNRRPHDYRTTRNPLRQSQQ